MKDLLILFMWNIISSKLHFPVDECQAIITRVENRFDNDNSFNLNSLSKPIQDSFNLYLETKRKLND